MVTGAGARLSAAARRDALLDAARALVLEGGPAAVTMGTVAVRAGVTRALVYKHFTDRADVLAALYRREAGALDRTLRDEVLAEDGGFEAQLRVFVRGAIRSAGPRAEFFAPLRGYGLDDSQRRVRRTWHRRTLDHFTRVAAAEYGLEPAVAQDALTLLLPGIVTLATAAARPTAARRRSVEDLCVGVATSALRGLRR